MRVEIICFPSNTETKFLTSNLTTYDDDDDDDGGGKLTY